ncbi:Hypothetical predicted protein, partial [Olea europaea subsp. europaea]
MAFGDLAVVGMGKLGRSSGGRDGGGNLAMATEVILTPSLEMWEVISNDFGCLHC